MQSWERRKQAKRNMGGVSVPVQEKCNLEKGGNEQKRNMGGAWFPSREVQTLQRRKRANCEYGCLMYWTRNVFHSHPYSRFSVPFPPWRKESYWLLLVKFRTDIAKRYCGRILLRVDGYKLMDYLSVRCWLGFEGLWYSRTAVGWGENSSQSRVVQLLAPSRLRYSHHSTTLYRKWFWSLPVKAVVPNQSCSEWLLQFVYSDQPIVRVVFSRIK